MHIGPRLLRAALGLVALWATEASALEQPAAAVAVVYTAISAPGDARREGAVEMLVWLEIARLQNQSSHAGLVAIGDRRGLFPAGAEDALHDAVLRGLPVVKLARGGRVLAAPHGLFLDGGILSEEEAVRVLRRCLELFGSLPAAASHGTGGSVPRDLRERLRQYQDEFTLAASARLAAR